ncbi:MAG: hypothetical protein AAGF06_07225, partial [Pseudomonadota bacterium]
SPYILDYISSFARMDYANVKPALFIAFNSLLSYIINTASNSDTAQVVIDTLNKYPIFEEHYEKTFSQNNQLLNYGALFLNTIVGNDIAHIKQLLKSASQQEEDVHLTHLLNIAACLIAKVLCKLKHTGGELKLMSALLSHQQQLLVSIQQGRLFTQHIEHHQPRIHTDARQTSRTNIQTKHPTRDHTTSAPTTTSPALKETQKTQKTACTDTDLTESIVLDDSSFAFSDNIHALHEFCQSVNKNNERHT